MIQRIAEELSPSFSLRGIITQEVRSSDGERMGFDVIAVHSKDHTKQGQRGSLARVPHTAQDAKKGRFA